MSRDLYDYLHKLERHDFKVEIAAKNYRIYAPDGQVFTCSLTPNCHHAHRNLYRDIRKYRKSTGYFLPPVK